MPLDDLEPGGDSAVLPMPAWPQDVQLRIKELKEELEEGEITKKGFWNKKFSLVEDYLSEEQTTQVKDLRSELKDGKLSDKDYYSKLESLLKPSKKFVDDGFEMKEDNPDKENEASNSQKKTPKTSSFAGESTGSSFSSLASSSKAGSSSGAGFSKSVEVKDEEKVSSSSSSRGKSPRQSPRKDNDRLPSPKKDRNSKSKGQQSLKAMFARVPPAKRKTAEGEESASKKPKVSRCNECLQKTEENSNLVMYDTHPDQAVEEVMAVTDDKLRIVMDEADLMSTPEYKITNFNLYCSNGHCVRLDTNLIEKNKEVWMSGYLKCLISEDPGYGESSGEYSRAVKDIGPLYSWWNSGFDGGEIALSGVSSPIAEYYLVEPSEIYKPIFTAVQEKAIVTKHVIEFLLEAIQEGGGAKQLGQEWEDMLNYLSLQVTTLDLSEGLDDLLIKHAEFVIQQVYSYEEAGEEGEQQLLIHTEAMKQLIRIAGIKLTKVKKELKIGKNLTAKKVMPTHTEATVTPNVRHTFESVFSDQMRKEEVDNKSGKGKKRKIKCGMCDQCLKVDCGQCRNCKDMTKFGGSGKSKQACMERKCENMAAKGEDEVSDLEDEDEVDEEKLSPSKKFGLEKKTKSKAIFKDVEWVGAGKKIDRKTYYESAIVANDDQRITVVRGDFVLIQPHEPSIPLYIGKISTLYDGPEGAMTLVQWFARSTDTILGEAGDPTELFQLTDCEDQPLLSIWKKANVKFIPVPKQEEWRKEGGVEPEDVMKDDGVNFWYRFHYTPGSARFEYVEPLPECPKDDDAINYCPIEVKMKEENNRYIPRPLEKEDTEIMSVMWDKAPLKVGDCLYLQPGTIKRTIKTRRKEVVAELDENKDPVEFPEYYRKKGTIKGCNNDTPDPFDIVLIKQFKNDFGEIKMKVQIFYRPENTHKGYTYAESKYLNELYYSEEKAYINFDNVMGRCFVKFIDMNVDDKQIEVWTEEGPDRFFFREWYNSLEDKNFEEPPLSAQRIGQVGKGGKGGKSKGKGKSSAKAEESADSEQPKEEAQPRYAPVSKPLRCLDIFSGCGGLSQGLHESGIAESCWAVEIFEPAAKAYKLNNDGCTVFRDDCNLLLKNAIDGVKENEKKQKIPQQGEVDLLCGGPPCQGFSGMNRFNMREYSQFKNSLVSTYLSYCDYYRPKYFILENVRNFASFKKGMVLKLCMTALIKMGYQCTFAILQAGQYGVAQTRRRAILLAAAPGQKLPMYPEPQHVFSARACSLTVNVADVQYKSNIKWTSSAPYRTTTVRDMMSDLPKIENGAEKITMSYGGEPRSHIQKMFRKSSTELRDHITKRMAPLIVKRFEFIPTTPGSDWRDLPNWSGELSDGTRIKKLEYRWHDTQQGYGPKGAKRGVCPCASGQKCDTDEKQEKTLIPWCLPHTGNRHNNWAGLYGRVEWDGYFSTTITNPEPMGKQGRVMHPEQKRVVSVRECARSQGFPDNYKFYGTPIEKYRQIGNAVPPALGKALGLAIREAAGSSDNKD